MEILKFPHPSLLTPTEPVTEFGEELASLLEEMFALMKASNGIGMAANQVGIGKRMFVMEGANEEPFFFVNPEIIANSLLPPTKFLSEGCLSAPGEFITITARHSWVIVRFQDEKGATRTNGFHGIHSVCVQHEMDHLNGKVFLDDESLTKKQRKQLKKKWGLK